MNKLFKPPITRKHNAQDSLFQAGRQAQAAQSSTGSSERMIATRRYLAISLPRLATDRIIRKRKGLSWRQDHVDCGEDVPMIVVDQIKNAWRITHMDEQAEAIGLSHHQSLSDARAICPKVEVQYEDPKGNLLLLEAIADWCDRYTPLVSLDAPDGIMLDITGCAHLFGGERPLIDELIRRLFQQGFAVSAAIASTPGAAWAVSRFSSSLPVFRGRNHSPGSGEMMDISPVIEAGKEEEALALLPLAGLRLDGETLGGLAKLGLRTIGQVLARPRAPLTRRFGKLLLLRLDQALGVVEEAFTARLPVPELMAERKLAEPIGRAEDIEILIERLAERLCADMEKREAGARNIDLALFRTDGKVVRLGVGTSSPLRDPTRIRRLFSERLALVYDDFDTGLGFEVGRLSAVQVEPCHFDQISVLNDHQAYSEFSHLMDKLGARLGLARIRRMVPGETHLPEQVDRVIPLIGDRAGDSHTDEHIQQHFLMPVRPMRLFKHPEPVEAIASVPDGPPVRFRWRRKLHIVVHVEGPERISSEWWNDHCPGNTRERKAHFTRDYFRIEDDHGHRYWLYRQGLYVSETNAPDWYMHGVFA